MILHGWQLIRCERQVLPLSNKNLRIGRFEKYNIVRNRLHFYNSVGVTARYRLGGHDNLQGIADNLENVIYSTVKHVIEVHPVLGITIAREYSRNPSFVRLTELDLTRIVRFTTESDVGRVIEDAHQNRFECLEQLPLWRLVVSRLDAAGHFYVCFFVHHGICDGTSGVAFHHTFLDALDALLKAPASAREPDPQTLSLLPVPQLQLLPSLEQAHSLPLSPRYVIGEVIKSLSHDDPQRWTGRPVTPSPNTTCLRLCFLANSQMTAINQLCRQHGVTFTALLTVQIARVLAKCIPNYPRFKCQVAMSFRRFTGTDQKAMVCYVSSFSHRFSTSSEPNYIPCARFSWDAVQSCYQEIREATSRPKNHKVGLLRFVRDYEGFFTKQARHQREDSFQVSNVGVMDTEGGDRAAIDRVIFSQSSNVIGSALVFSVASVKGGDLAIALTWQEGIVEVELAENVLKTLEAELALLAASLLD